MTTLKQQSLKTPNYSEFIYLKMGRIKSTLVKRTSNNLLKEENNFSENFNTNKKLLADTMPSKKVRNKIAGYISRIKKREKQEK